MPPQVPPTLATYPEAGNKLNTALVPYATVCAAAGLILPFNPALDVTIRVLAVGGDAVNVAKQVAFALNVTLVFVEVPAHAPDQPENVEPAFAVADNASKVPGA